MTIQQFPAKEARDYRLVETAQMFTMPLIQQRDTKWPLPAAVNTLNGELNPTCHFLALLGAHHIFHVSGIRVKPSPPATAAPCL
jgi:hypothetical protein